MFRVIATLFLILTMATQVQAQEEKKAEEEIPKLDYLKKAEISIMQFSHQDMGWHAGSYKREMRVVHRAIDKAMKMLNEDERFIYDGELVIWLHDYVRLHPDKVPELKKLIQARRIQWGAGYTQPYTSLLTHEQVARLMYLGRRWFKKQFDADTRLWYNTDVPGMTAQFPQVLAKSGIDKAYACRSWNIDNINTDFLNWYSPDGSSVFVYMMHHYGDNINWKPGAPKTANNNIKMAKWVASFEDDYKSRKILPVLPHLISKDNVGPRTDILPLFDSWNKFAKENEYPPMIYDSMSDMIDKVKASSKTKFKELKGDWPNKWLYEAAPANYEMFKYNRNASRMLVAAETFGAFRSILDGNWDNYPKDGLFQGWMDVDMSCHGIAPDSCVTNFLETYIRAHKNSKKMLDDQLVAIGAQIKTSSKRGASPVVVFNNLSWARTDVVQVPLPEEQTGCKVYDKDGKAIISQVSNGKVVFTAEDIPAFGYTTFYLSKSGKSKAGAVKPGSAWDKPFENDFFRITPGKQGFTSIFDKKLNRELLKTDKFEGAQWLNFKYKGQGTGEFTHVTRPTPDKLEDLGVFSATWSCKESGPLFTEFESKGVQTERGKVSFQVRMYDKLKRIDLKCIMLDCDEKEAQQIRLTFPLNADLKHIAFESTFGKVEIGKDEIQPHLAFHSAPTPEQEQAYKEKVKTLKKGWQKKMLWNNVYGDKTVRPREIQNWIYAGDGKAGVTIGSSVIAWDYLDSSHNPTREYPVLQPVLLCSAYSINRWKICFTQPGDHEFTFSIFSHEGDWRNGRKHGVATNNPLLPVIVKANPAGKLPASQSFLSVSADNVIVTAVKKSEDSDDVAIRFYETEGKEKTAVELSPFFNIKEARKTNLIEEDAGKMKSSSKKASMDVGKYSIETIRLVPKK